MPADPATLRRERPNSCNHYRAMIDHDACEAGVPYASFDKVGWEHRPCFLRAGQSKPGSAHCDHLALPSEDGLRQWIERLEEQKRKHEAIGPDIKAFRAANKRRSAEQTIPCRACGTGQLTMWIAASNGHVGGRCATKGCVAWQQ